MTGLHEYALMPPIGRFFPAAPSASCKTMAPVGSGYLAGHCVRSQSGSRGEGSLAFVRACLLSQSASGTGVGHALMRGCVGWR
jgi:hypothetical protein